jgi:hypothetical protein
MTKGAVWLVGVWARQEEELGDHGEVAGLRGQWAYFRLGGKLSGWLGIWARTEEGAAVAVLGGLYRVRVLVG